MTRLVNDHAMRKAYMPVVFIGMLPLVCEVLLFGAYGLFLASRLCYYATWGI